MHFLCNFEFFSLKQKFWEICHFEQQDFSSPTVSFYQLPLAFKLNEPVSLLSAIKMHLRNTVLGK